MATTYKWSERAQYTKIGETTDGQGETHEVLEPQFALPGADGPGFVCPVTAMWLPVAEGVKVGNTYYSPEGARDIIREKQRNRGL